MGVAASAIQDLINLTKEDMGGPDFQVTQEYPKYEAVNRWLRGDSVETIESGDEIKRDIMTGTSDAAEEVDLHEEQDISIQDLMSKVTVGWNHINTHWAFERREGIMNKKPAQIVDLIKARRTGALLSLADKLELRAWSCPASTATKQPYGIPYWVPGLDDGQAGAGFYGGSVTASGHTSTGGIDPATANDNTTSISGGVPRWRSYAAGGAGYYTAMDRTAFRTMKTMYRNINFQSPELPGDMEKVQVGNYRIYMNDYTLNLYEDMVTNQNDRVGPDGAAFMDRTSFKRIPLTWSPILDADLRDPVYMINHNVWKGFILGADNFIEHPAEPVSQSMHNSYVVWIDLTYAYACLNRRENGVMRKTAARS